MFSKLKSKSLHVPIVLKFSRPPEFFFHFFEFCRRVKYLWLGGKLLHSPHTRYCSSMYWETFCVWGSSNTFPPSQIYFTLKFQFFWGLGVGSSLALAQGKNKISKIGVNSGTLGVRQCCFFENLCLGAI